jgi:serine/threonine-protein kinase RsbW
MSATPGALDHASDVQSTREVVSIQTPAVPRYVAVIRLTAAAVSSRLGFTLDEVEDLKLAVDEAVSLLIESASQAATISVDFNVNSNSMRVEARVSATKPPDESSYGWGVLRALSSDAKMQFVGGIATVSFTSARSAMDV